MTEVTISDIGNALVAIDLEVKRIDDEIRTIAENLTRLQNRKYALTAAVARMLANHTYVLEKY